MDYNSLVKTMQQIAAETFIGTSLTGGGTYYYRLMVAAQAYTLIGSALSLSLGLTSAVLVWMYR